MGDPTLFDPRGPLFDRRPAPPSMPPFQRHSETSRAAAAAIYGKTGSSRRAVYDWLRSRGELGGTDEEICAWTGLSSSTVRPRRVELVRDGLVVESDARRRTQSGRWATVWRTKGDRRL